MTNRPSGNKLLIVEDNSGVADLISEVAEELGFLSEIINDGTVFHNAFARNRPTVIILDLNLPGVDGIEILRFLGDQKCQAKILIASGVDSRTLSAVSMIGIQRKLNIVGTLPKPLTVESIEAALSPLRFTASEITGAAVNAALDNAEIQVHYQPKIDILNSSGTSIIGIEGLVRWHRPDGVMIFPDQFLPVAASAGLMAKLTDTVATQAVLDARVWRRQGLDLTTSINLDGSLLNDLTWPDKLYAMADEAGIPTNRLTVEVTEAAAMADTTATMDILTRLRIKEFNVSMDDFGTGFSSLTQLYRLPFNELKIDKSFVMDIEANSEAGVIVEMLTTLGHKLGLKVCAEGVENKNVLDAIRNFGCDLAQGYLFSRPVPAEEITKLAGTSGSPWTDLNIQP